MRRLAYLADLVTVSLFVVIGRASHHHGQTVGGFLSTAWPFLAGLVIGWWAAGRRRPTAVSSGLVTLVGTVAVGMALRVVAGQGTAVAFIAVALVFLGALMVGSRLALGSFQRRRTAALHL